MSKTESQEKWPNLFGEAHGAEQPAREERSVHDALAPGRDPDSKFSYEKARAELEAAAQRASEAPLPSDHPWVRQIEHFGEIADASAKTHIAMLGTAILAKATSPKADLTRLKVDRRSPGSYYARGLADSVLARVARLLNIDVGANGPNPLNNSPYRGKETLAEVGRTVRQDLQPVFIELLRLIDQLQASSQEQAREALQAFAQARTRPRTAPIELPPGLGHISPDDLTRGLQHFVASDSEGGRRAQAAAAGVLDAEYGSANVLVAAVNDPDRRFPGDVGVCADGRIVWSLEVRDKPIGLTDLLDFVEKMARRGVPRAAILAVAAAQSGIAADALESRAEELGVSLRLFMDWGSFVREAVFYASGHPAEVLDAIRRQVLARAQELHVSSRGVREWQDIALAIRRRTPSP